MRSAPIDLSIDDRFVENYPLSNEQLPDYEPMLDSYHKAFSTELKRLVQSLPIREGNLVLEMACGDGAYTGWLSDLAGETGRVVGLDLLPDYLRQASLEIENREVGCQVDFVAASIDRLPFNDRTFDVAWCAQSLFSLPDPLETVRQMCRVVKLDGLVAVLENDTLHQILLPWPVDVELAIRGAEWEALRDESPNPSKFYVGRRLGKVFREAGLSELRINSFAHSRLAPIEPHARRFLEAYLDDLRQRVTDRIDSRLRSRFLNLIDPQSSDYLVDEPDFQFTTIDHVVQGRVAG
jgi:ubiquinone/menaquinone biosynthesis C-methylase UbiE